MWDEGLVWKGSLSGKTVWIKRLGKDLKDDDVMMMVMMITMMLIVYGTYRLGPSRRLARAEISVSSSWLRLNWDCERFPCCKISGLSSLL